MNTTIQKFGASKILWFYIFYQWCIKLIKHDSKHFKKQLIVFIKLFDDSVCTTA